MVGRSPLGMGVQQPGQCRPRVVEAADRRLGSVAAERNPPEGGCPIRFCARRDGGHCHLHHAVTGTPRPAAALLTAVLLRLDRLSPRGPPRSATMAARAASALCRMGEPAWWLDCRRRGHRALDRGPADVWRTPTGALLDGDRRVVSCRHSCHAVWIRTVAVPPGNGWLLAP